MPGGFGNRGTRGMMKAAQIARERGIPYFGICYGFQWATVEYARNVAGLADADSTECNPDTPTKVIYKLRDLLGVDDLGGTMRLGSYACELAPGSLAQRVYGTDQIARASSPPLRVQLPLRTHAHRTRPAHFGPLAGRQIRRDRRIARLIRGILLCSFIPSSSRSRCGRIHCLPASSKRPIGTRLGQVPQRAETESVA